MRAINKMESVIFRAQIFSLTIIPSRGDLKWTCIVTCAPNRTANHFLRRLGFSAPARESRSRAAREIPALRDHCASSPGQSHLSLSLHAWRAPSVTQSPSSNAPAPSWDASPGSKGFFAGPVLCRSLLLFVPLPEEQRMGLSP